MKEGCLTYPFLFLNIKRPRKIVAKFEDENGEQVFRSYTPVSSDNDIGFVDFVVKIYRKFNLGLVYGR